MSQEKYESRLHYLHLLKEKTTKLPTADEEKLKALKDQMDLEVRYSEKWFRLKEKYQELFQKIEKLKK